MKVVALCPELTPTIVARSVVHVLGLCCEFRVLCCCGLAVLACSLGSLFARAWCCRPGQAV